MKNSLLYILRGMVFKEKSKQIEYFSFKKEVKFIFRFSSDSILMFAVLLLLITISVCSFDYVMNTENTKYNFSFLKF